MTDTIVTTAGRTKRLDMAGADTLTVQSGALFGVSANAQTVRFTAATNGAKIVNDGTIENTVDGGGRAIRFEKSVGTTLKAEIVNGGTIRSVDDALQIQEGSVVSGEVVVTNKAGALISAGTGQAIDFAEGRGAFVARIVNDGNIFSDANDGVRVGGVGNITNSGVIDGGHGAGNTESADGIQFDKEGGTGLVVNKAGGTISGDRHGINATDNTSIVVVNEADGTITGRNGAGVGSDGSATVVNYGTISGNFTPGLDINGPGGEDAVDGIDDGDGDGIDIDYFAIIDNYGTVRGTGAGGNGSDGFPNTSEGIAAGGGRITNHEGALISGAGLGILIDNSSQGPAFYQTTLINDGTITSGTGTAIRIVSNHDDTIANSGTIKGGNGVAIEFGSGDNTLFIGTGSVIKGLVEGGAGSDTLSYADFDGNVSVDLSKGVATGSGRVSGFEIVIGGSGNDKLVGSMLADILIGGAGNDWIDGGQGADTMGGGAGNDTYVFDDAGDRVIGETSNGGQDTIWATVSVDLRQQTAVENLRLGGAGDIDATGNALANLITGNAGSNVIAGGAGNDSLYGKGGADTFVFAEKGAEDRDSIWDFDSDDRIALDASVFSGLQAHADGSLSAASFAVGKATGTDAQIVYNKATGVLSYDANGSAAGGNEDIAFIGKNLAFFDQNDIFLI